MVDVYHLFKLGVTAGKIIKTSKSISNVGLIFKHVAKPMIVLGISGAADAACDEAAELIINKIKETE